MQAILNESRSSRGAELRLIEKILDQVMSYQNADVVARLQKKSWV